MGLEDYELLREAAEEAYRMRRHAGIGFKGSGSDRRAWAMGTGLDVWEVVEMYQIEGRERLLAGGNWKRLFRTGGSTRKRSTRPSKKTAALLLAGTLPWSGYPDP